MFRVWKRLQALFWPQSADVESVLDQWISDAMLEEAVAQPPSGAWDRLRMALDRRRTQRQGMWVLNEPLRDPPERSSSGITPAQLRRVERLYAGSHPDTIWYMRENVFMHFAPAFFAMINY